MFLQRARAEADALLLGQTRNLPPTAEEVEAGRKLRTKLLLLHLKKGLDATDLCELAHWLVLSRGTGVDDFAMDPAKNGGGNCAKHLRLVLAREYPDPGLYYCEVPCYDKYKSMRTTMQLPIHLPTEFLCDQLSSSGDVPDDPQVPLPNAKDAELGIEYIPRYDEHPVIIRAQQQRLHKSRIRACSLYMDAAQFTKRDSFEGVFFQDLVSGDRTLIAIIRSLDLCDCGCKGRCTMWYIYWLIAWDLNNGARGELSTARHDGESFADSGYAGDAQRAERSRFLGFVMALLEIRADWPALTKPFPAGRI